ncbi:cell division protein FtsQ/DivIB [Streptomyces sp. URMC 123]|uniref:cell division protein FtsQ/DivIB n=1 Tax=Streptomyces sp. URMC 123 TaxID=3423403 RepID=UPI003F1E1C82
MRPRRPGRRGLIVGLVLALALAGGGGWLLYGSAWLRVERVTTTGTLVLTPEAVRSAADIPLGVPMAAVDTDGVADRLRQRLPRIAQVDVVRVWPRSIALKVTERKPQVVLEKGGKFIEVDADGVRFATVDTPPKGVPRLEWDGGAPADGGRFGAERLQRSAARVAAELPGPVHQDTRVIRVRSYDAIALELTRGRTVMWGSPERGRAKAASLVALMKAARDAHHFDVSVPSAPAATGS